MSDTNSTNPGGLDAALLAKIPRHTFTIPESAKELATDPTVVTLRQLTLDEEIQATTAAGVSGKPIIYESTMRAVVAADNVEITWTGDGKVRFFAGVSSKVRDLIIQAFGHISLPARKDSEAFLSSEVTTL